MTSEFEEALERIVAGPERKSRVISDAEKAIIAYHEGGHAVVQRILPKCDPVQKVTIISRGMALGYTMALPHEDRYLQSKTEFEDKIAGLLGGNAAERLVFGDTTTGASNDIEKATDLARRMVTEFGMSDKLGPLAFGKRDELVFLGREIGEQRNYSDDIAARSTRRSGRSSTAATRGRWRSSSPTATGSRPWPRSSSPRRPSTATRSRRSSRTSRRRRTLHGGDPDPRRRATARRRTCRAPSAGPSPAPAPSPA